MCALVFVDGWKKLLANILIKCNIINKDFSGEITFGINKGAVSWNRSTTTTK